MSAEREYIVGQRLTISATTVVTARSAAEAVRKVEAVQNTVDSYVFEFSLPERETKLRAELVGDA